MINNNKIKYTLKKMFLKLSLEDVLKNFSLNNFLAFTIDIKKDDHFQKNIRMIKKILVTGSEGFIGSHLVEFLVEKKISNKYYLFYNIFV